MPTEGWPIHSRAEVNSKQNTRLSWWEEQRIDISAGPFSFPFFFVTFCRGRRGGGRGKHVDLYSFCMESFSEISSWIIPHPPPPQNIALAHVDWLINNSSYTLSIQRQQTCHNRTFSVLSQTTSLNFSCENYPIKNVCTFSGWAIFNNAFLHSISWQPCSTIGSSKWISVLHACIGMNKTNWKHLRLKKI